MSAQIGLLTGEVNSLRATVTEIGETVAQQKSEIELEAGRLGEALTTNSAAFEQTQAERQENFTSQLSAFESQLAGALEEASQSAANALADLSEKSDAAIAEIEAIRELGEVSEDAVSVAVRLVEDVSIARVLLKLSQGDGNLLQIAVDVVDWSKGDELSIERVQSPF
jgi:hypothetical protein